MSLANPAMLAGLALVVLPLIAHLTGAREVRRVSFPTTRFLGEAHQSLRRRWLLGDLALLAVRIAAITAVVLLFCRPSWNQSVQVSHGVDPSVPTVLVVDRSLSTHQEVDGERAFDAIRERALEHLRVSEAPAVVVLLDDRAVAIEGGYGADAGRLIRALTKLEPGQGATALGEGIRLASDLLAAREGGQVLVLGDGTATTLEGVGAIPEGVTVAYIDLSRGTIANTYPETVTLTQQTAGIGVDVTLGHSLQGGDDPTPIDLYVGGIEPLRGMTAPGRSMSFTVVAPPAGLVPCVAEVAGDDLGADNEMPFFLHGEQRIDVHLLGGHGGASQRGGELYFLLRALDPDGDSGLRPQVLMPGDLAGLPATRGTVLILSDVPCTEELASEVERLVTGGGAVLMAAGSLLDRRDCNDRLGGLLPAQLGSIKSRELEAFEHGPIGLAAPDVTQPLWEPFRLGGLGTFASARFDRVLEVEPHLAPDSDVLLRYTDGRAAILSRAVGEGRVLLFTSTLDADWNDLPIRAIYVPMVHQLVRYLAGEIDQRGGEIYQVGDRPDLALEPPSESLLRDPRGVETPLERGERLQLPRLDHPGHYQILGSRGDLLWQFGVRVDPAESAMRPLDPGALAEAVPGAAYVREGDGIEPDRATVLRPVSLVPHLAALLLLALGGEALLGRRR